MRKIDSKFLQRPSGILNVYFTAGYPSLNDTTHILQALDAAGVDIIELGIPFSDPLADGPTIQEAGQKALENGMSLQLLLHQLKTMAYKPSAAVVLMGYWNTVLQYGIERFLADASRAGVDGLIVPDLPLEVYQKHYQSQFEAHGLGLTFLVTPRTDDARLRAISASSKGFVYVVSSASITGGQSGIGAQQVAYFKRLAESGLEKPRLIGFGIANAEDFEKACLHAHGAIVGSAFIRHLSQNGTSAEGISRFVNSIRVSTPTNSTHP